MTAGAIRKLLEDLAEDANINFSIGDHDPLAVHESYTTTTKDAAFITFAAPEGWSKQ